MNRRSSNLSKDSNEGPDPAVLEQLVQALIGQAQGSGSKGLPGSAGGSGPAGPSPHKAFNRLSRSMKGPSFRGERRRSSAFNQGRGRRVGR